MKIITRVPGKLILLGEYAVLEGASALVATVDRFAQVTIETSGASAFLLEAPTIDIPGLRFLVDASGRIRFLESPLRKTVDKLNLFMSIFEYGVKTLKKHGKSLLSGRILLDTSEFFYKNGKIKLGLGSSAALTVALLANVFENGTQLPQDLSLLFEMAMEAHRNAQGNVGSGIDIAASVYGGVLCYKIHQKEKSFKADVHPLTIPKGLHYLPIWAGKASSTPSFVKRFYDFKKFNRKDYSVLMEEMHLISREGCEAFKEGEVDSFLESVQNYYKIMEQLGEKIEAPVISHEHQIIAEISQSAGAAYKPSGAGGGDLGIAFSDDPAVIEGLRLEVEAAGFDVLDLDFGSSGLQIKNEEEETNGHIAHS